MEEMYSSFEVCGTEGPNYNGYKLHGNLVQQGMKYIGCYPNLGELSDKIVTLYKDKKIKHSEAKIETSEDHLFLGNNNFSVLRRKLSTQELRQLSLEINKRLSGE